MGRGHIVQNIHSGQTVPSDLITNCGRTASTPCGFRPNSRCQSRAGGHDRVYDAHRPRIGGRTWAVKTAGADVWHARSPPQAKGKIERPYRWLQDRLVRRCAKEEAMTIGDARILPADEVRRYNERRVHSTTLEIPILRFERAVREGQSQLRPFTLPQPPLHQRTSSAWWRIGLSMGIVPCRGASIGSRSRAPFRSAHAPSRTSFWIPLTRKCGSRTPMPSVREVALLPKR